MLMQHVYAAWVLAILVALVGVALLGHRWIVGERFENYYFQKTRPWARNSLHMTGGFALNGMVRSLIEASHQWPFDGILEFLAHPYCLAIMGIIGILSTGYVLWTQIVWERSTEAREVLSAERSINQVAGRSKNLVLRLWEVFLDLGTKGRIVTFLVLLALVYFPTPRNIAILILSFLVINLFFEFFKSRLKKSS